MTRRPTPRRTTVDRLLQVERQRDHRCRVLVGVSLTVIDKIAAAGVVEFSPANTSDQFTTYNDNGPVLPHRAAGRPAGRFRWPT